MAAAVLARPTTGSGAAPAKRNRMDRFIDGIELTAAIFIGIVAADVFITVMLRYFGISIPDSYDFGQLLLGILIFWGIAATSYRGTHITVDLVWANVGPRWQRVIDVFATLVLLFVVVVQTYTLFDKVVSTYSSNVQHLRPAAADLAVLPGRLARRRLGRAADRRAHLSADLPARAAGAAANQQIRPVE